MTGHPTTGGWSHAPVLRWCGAYWPTLALQAGLQLLQALLLLLQFLPRMLQTPRQIIQPLFVALQPAPDIALQAARQLLQVQRHFNTIWADQLGGGCRRGSAPVGNKIGNGHIGFVAHA